MMKRGCARQMTKGGAGGWEGVRDSVCGIALWKKDGGQDRRKIIKLQGETRTKCVGAQAITHPPPEVPPPVSNSTGKACCSPEVVVSEGAKKEKKESISVRLGGEVEGIREVEGSVVEAVVG